MKSLQNDIKITGNLSGYPRGTIHNRERKEKEYEITGGAEGEEKDKARLDHGGLRMPFHTLRRAQERPISTVHGLVTFHLSPSYPGTGRGSNTFSEKEQKLYIAQSPQHRMKGRHTKQVLH